MLPLVLASVSKVPFYIAGGAFAIWAVVLSVIGLKRADFPYSERGTRVVILISALLVVVTLAMAIHTSTFE